MIVLQFWLLFIADSPSEADWCLTLTCKHSTIALIYLTASPDKFPFTICITLMVGPQKPLGQRINLQHCTKTHSVCLCVRVYMSRLCSSFVNWEIFTAVSVCSSVLVILFCSEGAVLSLENRFEGFEGFFFQILQDVMKRNF